MNDTHAEDSEQPARKTAAELEDERRRGRLAGTAAIGSGVLFATGMIWSQVANKDAPNRSDKPAEYLRFYEQHSGELLASTGLQSIAMLVLAFVAVHLYRALKARKPTEPRIVLFAGIYGPVMLGVATLAASLVLGDIARDFADRAADAQTKQAAEDILKGAGYQVAQAAGFSGALALVFWFIKGCYDAMRVGLLSRVLGFVGVILGPALLFGIGQLLLPFWLLALGFLFLGVTPVGRAPAWEKGEAVEVPGFGGVRKPLPPPEEPAVGGERNGEVEAVGPGVKAAEAEEDVVEADQPHLERRKRKRRD